MTIVVYRDGIMASDSASFQGPLISGLVKKVHKTKHGMLVGGAGQIAHINALAKLVEGHKTIEDIDFGELIKAEDLSSIIVEKNGTVWIYDGGLYPFRMEAPYYVEGAGCEIAIGALYMGATAEQAAEAAIRHSKSCGGPVQVVKL